MKVRYRILLGFATVVVTVFALLATWLKDELRIQPLKAMEETMVDTAHMLAAALESGSGDIRSRTGSFRDQFQRLPHHRFQAQVYELRKELVVMRVYVTDEKGIVVFDSDGGKEEGKDYSGWNDVSRTLKGVYGARATRSNPEDFYSSVFYVAAPIYDGANRIGVVSVGKSAISEKQFITAASSRLMLYFFMAGLAAVGLSFLIAAWITRPILRLARYADAVREGKRRPLPPMGSGELATLGQALEDMRTALEGRRYVEQYVHALTHEIKGPLSSIHGAAELLQEEMPPEDRKRFTENISRESERIRRMVDRLLELAMLENLSVLPDMEEVDLSELAADIAESAVIQARGRNVTLALKSGGPAIVRGDRCLLRQAMSNLVQNALEFTPEGGTVEISTLVTDQAVEFSVLDTGPGIPDYARERVFERFYSLPRPVTRAKSSGLGLTITREVSILHGGVATLENAPGGGACASIRLPR